MIQSLGGTVQTNSPWQCCMVCNPTMFGDGSRLAVVELGGVPSRRRRRVAVRKVTGLQMEVLESSLKAERANYISEHPNLAILGVQLVCPNSTIKNICSGAKFISILSDMDSFCIRRELKQRFFNVIMLVVNH